MMGGYFAVEFARDKEVQSPLFNTTQETVANFMKHWTSVPALNEEFGGLPICVIGVGIHDMMLRIPLEVFVRNVEWYLLLLKAQCSHIIWLQNTAPLRINDDDRRWSIYVQTIERVRAWDEGVGVMLQKTAFDELRNHTTVMNVLDASLVWPGHADNIHMDNPWYEALGDYFKMLSQHLLDPNATQSNDVVNSNNRSGMTDDELEPDQSTRRGDQPVRGVCVWNPNAASFAGDECTHIIRDRIQASVSAKTSLDSFPPQLLPRRWFFFGGDQISNLFRYSSLKSHLIDDALAQMQQGCPTEYICWQKRHRRCGLARFFEVERKPNNTWTKPKIEGPLTYGLKYPNCQDCAGCNSHYTICSKKSASVAVTTGGRALSSPSHTCGANNTISHGGFFSIEYVRDVELQSVQYDTTQENVASYISSHFDTADLNKLFGGQPVCVVGSTSTRDLSIPGITLELYVSNVAWYLEMLLDHCSHIIWVEAVAPLLDDASDKRRISKALIHRWNKAVRDLLNLSSNAALRQHTTVMDIYEASKAWPHFNNIAMNEAWHRSLGNFFVQLSQSLRSVR